MVNRIAILGPESTGKSVLSAQLADEFNTVFVEEYSRLYFASRDYVYDIHDLEKIAFSQLKNEEELFKKANNLLICDTEFITIKVWSDIVFNSTLESITRLIETHIYDMYLLCNLDVCWQPDPLRNNEHNRDLIFNRFVNELSNFGFNYKVVSGIGNERLKNAVNFVNQYLNNEL